MGFVLPAGIVNTDSAFFYADTTFKFGPLVKEPGDQTLIVVDYSLLTPSHVINAFSFTLDVTSNPALVVAYPALNATKSVLTFLVSGGIVGQQYNLSINTTLDINARIDVLTINVPSSGGECERINPVPELYTQFPLGSPTQGYVNTGVRYFWGAAPPANPTVMDQWYSPATQVLSEYVTDGKTYHWQILMNAGLVEEAPLGNILYSRFNGYWVATPIQADALGDGRMYARQNNLWTPIPPIIADAPNDGTRYVRYNGLWQRNAIQTDAPNDGNLYARNGGVWALAYPVGNPSNYQTAAQVAASLALYLALTGGTLTGGLRVNQDLYIDGLSTFIGNAVFDGSVALSNDPISDMQAANKRYVDHAIANIEVLAPYLPLAGGTMTGALVLAADPTSAMLAANKRYVDNSIATATGALPFLPLIGGTVTGDLHIGGVLSVTHPPAAPFEVATKAYVDANSAGGIGDAPLDGFTYGRANNAWSKALAITGGTLTGALVLFGDPTTGLQATTKNYVDGLVSGAIGSAQFLPLAGGTLTGPLILSGAPTTPAQASTKAYVDGKASVALPIMDGVANPGLSTLLSRDDHSHPTDTTRYAVSNPAGYQTATQVTGAVQGAASTTFPLMDGARATGVGTTWARADHVHPTDTTLYPASNPSGYQTAADVAAYVNNAIANANIDCGTY